MLKQFLLTSLLSSAALPAVAQAIGLMHPEKLMAKGLAVKYENDAAGKTDYYYTQGIQIAFTHPSLSSTPVNKILPRLHQGNTIYGLALEHNAYTPTSIESDTILTNDRPFAAAVMLESFAVSINTMQQARLSTQLTVGLLGPGAGGEEMQTLIHRNTNNTIPHGWQYQIGNDLILNYYLRYDRNIFNARNILVLNAGAGLAAGTYSDKLFTCFNLCLGQQNNPLSAVSRKDLAYNISYQPTLNLVGYDATLQGGLLNRKNIYTIFESRISSIVLKHEIDLTVSYKAIKVVVNYTRISREFSQGRTHVYGGLQFAVSF